jgi:hypothetical protein
VIYAITALDTTALSLLLIPASPVTRPGTKKLIKHAPERLQAFVDRTAQAGESILLPTPVLSEVFVGIAADKIQNILVELNASKWFRIEGFDLAAAIELADRTAKAKKKGDKREGIQATWNKVKFDRQIMAIAIVNGASDLISNDPHLIALGKQWGFPVLGIEELPLPAELIPPPLLAPLHEENGK